MAFPQHNSLKNNYKRPRYVNSTLSRFIGMADMIFELVDFVISRRPYHELIRN